MGRQIAALAFYWLLIALTLIVLSVGLALMVVARVGEVRPATAGRRLGRGAGLLLANIVLINVAVSFLEYGLGQCKHSPTRHQLLGANLE